MNPSKNQIGTKFFKNDGSKAEMLKGMANAKFEITIDHVFINKDALKAVSLNSYLTKVTYEKVSHEIVDGVEAG